MWFMIDADNPVGQQFPPYRRGFTGFPEEPSEGKSQLLKNQGEEYWVGQLSSQREIQFSAFVTDKNKWLF